MNLRKTPSASANIVERNGGMISGSLGLYTLMIGLSTFMLTSCDSEEDFESQVGIFIAENGNGAKLRKVEFSGNSKVVYIEVGDRVYISYFDENGLSEVSLESANTTLGDDGVVFKKTFANDHFQTAPDTLKLDFYNNGGAIEGDFTEAGFNNLYSFNLTDGNGNEFGPGANGNGSLLFSVVENVIDKDLGAVKSESLYDSVNGLPEDLLETVGTKRDIREITVDNISNLDSVSITDNRLTYEKRGNKIIIIDNGNFNFENPITGENKPTFSYTVTLTDKDGNQTKLDFTELLDDIETDDFENRILGTQNFINGNPYGASVFKEEFVKEDNIDRASGQMLLDPRFKAIVDDYSNLNIGYNNFRKEQFIDNIVSRSPKLSKYTYTDPNNGILTYYVMINNDPQKLVSSDQLDRMISAFVLNLPLINPQMPQSITSNSFFAMGNIGPVVSAAFDGIAKVFEVDEDDTSSENAQPANAVFIAADKLGFL